ncbi:AAA family ATPase [Horticoccus luteus]|uniref:AAA family ATPase n=1 Tax=Horticoccus luteus TaxID=2862869 RepID=A0A8F9TYK4_9BACT|nr:AAA family ATPase [Horticoccus luteus]QYM80224.1 AAA family ATPase [Horticoccus luteus]
MIASVHFQRFKALRDTRLNLLPFNLVIGPNGSGKTSLLQAIERLCALAKLPLATEEVAGRTDAAEVSFTFTAPHAHVEARLGCVDDLRCDLLRTSAAGPEWEALREKLRRGRNYAFDPATLALPARRAEGGELAGDGRNLAAVLAMRQERHPGWFARMEQEFLRVMPEFSALSFSTPAAEQVALEMVLAGSERGARVAADDVSQGTLVLLALLALAFDPAPPPIMCFDEVERGLHPRLLREVRDTLYRLSYPLTVNETREPVQIVATTHSPYLVDLFREHPEEIVISHKIGTRAHFERLSERKDLPGLLGEGSLGDIWFSGILGGVPEER